jgi:hypothetical protein
MFMPGKSRTDGRSRPCGFLSAKSVMEAAKITSCCRLQTNLRMFIINFFSGDICAGRPTSLQVCWARRKNP